MDQFFLICNIAMGACVFGATLAARPAYTQLVNVLEQRLGDRLRQLRLPRKTLRRRINLWLAIVGVVFFVLWVALDSLLFAVIVAVALAIGPWYIVRRIAKTRRFKIEDQLADAMVGFSSGVKAGLSIPQALEMLANDCPKPIQQEFAQIIGEYKMGKPLDRTLTEAKARLRSENFVLFAAALLASRESGGRLNEIVDRISRSVLEIQRLERKIRSETAQARKSAVYMAAVPPLLLVVYAFVDPENTARLFSTLPGQIILSMAILLNVIAYFWALKILDADI